MHIDHLHIRGFRGLRDLQVPMNPQTVLIGPNNVGKTAVIDAIVLLLGRGRIVKRLTEQDFFGSDPSPDTRIHIRGVITGFASQNPADYPSVFNINGAIPAWWNPQEGELQHEEPGEELPLALEIGFSARFDNETLDVETIRYHVDGDVDPFLDDSLRRLSSGFIRDYGLFLIPSSRTWDRILTFRHRLFRRALEDQDALPSATVAGLRKWLQDPPHQIEMDPNLVDLVNRVNAELAGYIGGDSADLRFRPTTGDTEGVLDAIHAFLPDRSGGYLPLSRHGSGVRSLQTLLLLLQLGHHRNAEGANFALAVEEPELHLHPGHHRRIVARLRGISNQSVITTHSPLVASYHSAHEIVVLRSEAGDTSATPLIPTGGKIPERNALLRLFTLYRVDLAEALMSSQVLLPEGLTEFRWFRSFMQTCITAEGWDPELVGSTPDAMGVLPTQSSNIVPTYQHFVNLIPRIVPLIDGDDAGDEFAKQLGALDSPPPVIAQLRDGWSLEDLVIWVFCGDGSTAPEDVADVLDLPAAPDRSAFRRLLVENKTRWDRHEQLAGALATAPGAIARVRRLIQGLTDLAAHGTTDVSEWRRETRSEEAQSLWRFAPSAAK